MKKTALLNACGVAAKWCLNTLIIAAALAEVAMLVAREFIDE